MDRRGSRPLRLGIMQALLRGRGRSRLLPSWTQLRPVVSRGGRAGALGCAIVVLAALCVSCEASVDAPEDIGTSTSALAVAGLFPTGVNAMGARLAVGAINPHYVLSSTDANFPGPNALTVTPAGGWAAAGANSRWISIRASTNGAMGGVYTYTTTFTLAGVDPATATLSGRWACDDSCVLRLNGTQVATESDARLASRRQLHRPRRKPLQGGGEHARLRHDERDRRPDGSSGALGDRNRLGLQRGRPVLRGAVLQHAVGDVRSEARERLSDPHGDRPHAAARGGLHGRRRHRGVHVGGLRHERQRVRPGQRRRRLHRRRRRHRVPVGRVQRDGQVRGATAGATSTATAPEATGATRRRTPARPSSRTARRSPRTRRTRRRS